MILDNEVKVNVIGKTLQHFLELGYDIPHYIDDTGKKRIIGRCYSIMAKVEHLLPTSQVIVNVKCDVCGIEKKMKYKDYYESFSCRGYYTCKNCKSKKAKETNLERYGVECAVHSPEIYNKAVETWKKKYNTDHPLKSKEVIAKRQATLYKEGKIPTSKQQTYICNLLNGDLNVPINVYAMDIYKKTDNVCIEYDGSGHDLKVKKGQYTQGEFNRREYLKEKIIHDSGINLIRIISRKDKLPDDNTILKMYLDAIDYFNSGHTWRYYDIDNGTYKDSQHINGDCYMYGNLRCTKNLKVGHAQQKEVSNTT